MSEKTLDAELTRVANESDPVAKHLLLAALCTRLFKEHGVDLVVVGGSAIEFYTDGAYMSGDIDMCVARAKTSLTLRRRADLMSKLKAEGGPRSWFVGGTYIDILSSFENLAKTPVRKIQTEFGPVSISPIEELVVERVFVANYPSKYLPALETARKLIASALKKEVEIDWKETLRIATLSAYGNEKDLRQLVNEESETLAVRSPYHSDE